MNFKVLVGLTGALAITGALLWDYARHETAARKVAVGPGGNRHRESRAKFGAPVAVPKDGLPFVKAVPQAIRPILGLSGESLGQRWGAIGRLGTRLNDAECQALFEYLRGHEVDSQGPMRGVLKNDVILALKNQESPPKDLGHVLVAVFNDREQDPVIRNYALQHVGTWYDRCAEKTQVMEALWIGTADSDASIVGTALIGLKRLVQAPGGADKARLSTLASSLAADQAADEAARITALQVCAGLEVKGVVPTAVALAQSSASVPLRMSALAAVGALGGSEQIPVLSAVLADGDPRIQTAARAALRRLELRRPG
jgi:HEAT repeat protein